ncbi:uncharacterized protein LOC108927792 [Arapaima gigas]
MARSRSFSFSYLFTSLILTTVLLPAALVASPVGQHPKGDVGEATNGKLDGESSLKKLARNKRNISWYKQHSDFWSWYKYFTDTGNQKGVQELDRIYLQYLQNKNRAEGRRSYNHYLRHLGDIYKSCAESDDPNCVASYISGPKAKEEPPKPAPLKACDPYRDPHCLMSRGYPSTAPSGVKGLALIRGPAVPAPAKAMSSGYYYYSPVGQPFLSAQQQAELLRICDSKDVECLQYHLRAAYGYRASAGPAPSYAHLGCDPRKNPSCQPRTMQRTLSGYYHSYPTCDPNYDPNCIPNSAHNIEATPTEQPCNPIFDNNCNPLTATRLASRTEQETDLKDEPASSTACDPHYDPYCLHHLAAPAAAMQRQPTPPRYNPPQTPLQPEEDPRHSLGPRGKTKEGYDCYMFYDKECLPLGAQGEVQSSGVGLQRRAPAQTTYEDVRTNCHPYDPTCGRKTPHQHADTEAYEPHLNPDGTRNGVVEPDPDCDPEYDQNCRLRRTEEPKLHTSALTDDMRQEHQATKVHHNDHTSHQEMPGYDHQPDTTGYDQQHYDPYQSGHEDPYATYIAQDHMPTRLEDVMDEFGEQYPKYDDSLDHHVYSGEYKKK